MWPQIIHHLADSLLQQHMCGHTVAITWQADRDTVTAHMCGHTIAITRQTICDSTHVWPNITWQTETVTAHNAYHLADKDTVAATQVWPQISHHLTKTLLQHTCGQTSPDRQTLLERSAYHLPYRDTVTSNIVWPQIIHHLADTL